MSGTRILIHLLSVALLLLWGGVMLYFYASDRIIQYLPPDGIFQPMVLVAGVGLIVLGLFNLLTLRQKEHDCGHEHGHSHGPDHDHAGCCGHDHGHDHPHHAHEHDHHHHEHGDCCGHDHHTHAHHHHHEHKQTACCDHDHSEDHSHAHGMLEESGLTGRLVAISILAIPITLAALNTPDQYSPAAITNKGLYNPNYSDTSRAEQFSLKKERAEKPDLAGSPQPALADVANPDAPPGALPAPGQEPPTGSPAGSEPPASTSGGTTDSATPQSYGSFTLADLEAQVPKSEAGNFILDVPEIYYTGGDIEVQNVLKGQPVETVAQVLPEKVNNDDGHRLRIFRMLVQCCAADARPYSIPVDFGKTAPEFKEMAWVKVIGKIDYKEEGGQTVPVMQVTSIEETTAPDQTMIY